MLCSSQRVVKQGQAAEEYLGRAPKEPMNKHTEGRESET